MSAESSKQYGLILSKKSSSQAVIQRPSVFNEDSDSEDSGHAERDWRRKAYKADVKTVEKKQTKIQIQKALSEDPSIYQYDELYDEMKDNTNQVTKKKDEKKQSRYIQSLKRNAERRKIENERRMERQVQKEREEEGEQFKDKETFVTSSYKKKLEEFQKMEEEEKRMARLEEIGDVTKQKDISGFYRHLYESTVSKETTSNKTSQQPKKELDLKENDCSNLPKENSKPQDKKIKERQYRKRTKSASSKEEGEKTSSSESSNDDSDKERFSNSTIKKGRKLSGDERNEKTDKLMSLPKDKSKSPIKSNERKEGSKIPLKTNTSNNNKNEFEGGILKSDNVQAKVDAPKQAMTNIWLKRTVGINFDNALQRYLERKSNRQSGY